MMTTNQRRVAYHRSPLVALLSTIASGVALFFCTNLSAAQIERRVPANAGYRPELVILDLLLMVLWAALAVGACALIVALVGEWCEWRDTRGVPFSRNRIAHVFVRHLLVIGFLTLVALLLVSRSVR
jgi:hypothetical protein